MAKMLMGINKYQMAQEVFAPQLLVRTGCEQLQLECPTAEGSE
jgi:hypothetical protein